MPMTRCLCALISLLLTTIQLSAKGGNYHTEDLYNPQHIESLNLLPACVGDDIKQLLDAAASDRRNDAKLRAMGPDCVDHRGLLSNKQVPRAMEHQTTLLFRCLSRHKPHVGSTDRLAYRLGVSGIVLLSFDVRPHISPRHQLYIVSQCLKLAGPIMG